MKKRVAKLGDEKGKSHKIPKFPASRRLQIINYYSLKINIA